MNKQTLFVSLTAAVMLCACQSSKVKISGRIVGNDAKNVYLEQVSPLSQSVIDSAVLDKEGNYRFELKGVTRTPSLYNIIYNGERIPLFLAGGDRLSVNSVGSFIRNYTVEGSKETELLRQFYQAFVGGAQRLDNIAGQFARTNLSEEERKALVKEYTDEYYRIRREQLRFIIENKSSLAAVYALYQRLPGDTYLFNGDSDVVYYRTVAEALEQSYPDSPSRRSLLGEITRMDARISLTSRISEAGYPDLELSDIYGKKVRLSSLTGKVVLLDFWSAELGNSNTLNAELKEVYKKYADAPTPFEVYQVAVDSSKPLWITAVQEQQLPWISVSDLRGQASTAPRLYNVQKLPANFLIDREGTIVAKDIYGKSLERKLDELTKPNPGCFPAALGQTSENAAFCRASPRQRGFGQLFRTIYEPLFRIRHPSGRRRRGVRWGNRTPFRGLARRCGEGCGVDISGRRPFRLLVRIPRGRAEGLRADAGQAGRADRPGRAGRLFYRKP